jgi:hypothetical protein
MTNVGVRVTRNPAAGVRRDSHSTVISNPLAAAATATAVVPATQAVFVGSTDVRGDSVVRAVPGSVRPASLVPQRGGASSVEADRPLFNPQPSRVRDRRDRDHDVLPM